MPIRVGVFGAAGRMGMATCEALAADPDLELVAAIDQRDRGLDLTHLGLPTVSASADALAEAGADVAVEFTSIDAARDNVRWCAEAGVHAVVGTTGFTDDDLSALRGAFGRSNCLVAPNFAIGAVLMMRFAALAAPWFESAEIVEMHHEEKRDAPSGTAVRTARLMADASSEWRPDPTTKVVAQGARGGEVAGIHVHSLRLRGAVAHQEVLLGTTGQTLTIRHDSFDRTSFMPGVLLACKRIAEHQGVTVGLEAFLGL